MCIPGPGLELPSYCCTLGHRYVDYAAARWISRGERYFNARMDR
ncbi:hypothetical protein BURPSPAST_N0018 [Burkholderia pseudomallei Pasteur 52237]|nr:hypothetical protein BURPSPAST_N0018 [Burkholderia pseudomallei Pasteur 52237]